MAILNPSEIELGIEEQDSNRIMTAIISQFKKIIGDKPEHYGNFELYVKEISKLKQNLNFVLKRIYAKGINVNDNINKLEKKLILNTDDNHIGYLKEMFKDENGLLNNLREILSREIKALNSNSDNKPVGDTVASSVHKVHGIVEQENALA